MRKLLITLLMGLGLAGAAVVPAVAQTAPAATPAAKLSADSTLQALLDNAAARAILTKYAPLIVEHAPEYPEIYPMSLRTLSTIPQARTDGGLTDEALKSIEAELAKL